MLCLFDGLEPPGIAGELEQRLRKLPELLQFVDKHVLQLVECREHGMGKVFAHMQEDLLGETRVLDCRVAGRADAYLLANAPQNSR